jgi:RHS repeat-associated protein
MGKSPSYVDPAYADPGLAGQALAALIANAKAGAAGTVIDGANYLVGGITPFPVPIVLARTHDDASAPKAYLNYLIFDRNIIQIDGGYVQMHGGASGREDGTNVKHDSLQQQIVIKQPGYVYIYLSNEELSPKEVYFDDFKVQQIKSPVVQQEDFYPFGLSFNQYLRENSIPNRWKFQSQEHIDDLGLNWDQFKWRNHMPDIGRFFNVDKLAEKYPYWTPYAFSGNQVVNARELEGLEPYTVTGRSFIPMKTVPNPFALFSQTKSFKGDNRSFDPKATSFRTEQKVQVDFDNKKVTTLNNTASGSTGLDSKGNVTQTSQAEKAGPTPTYDKGAMEKGNSTTINMQVDASNQLVPGAPPINYDVNITISQQQDGSVNYNMTGSTDGFPAYEFYITNDATGQSTMIYGSDPQKTGDTPVSLFPPMEKNVNKSGNTGSTSDKKPDDKKKTN